MRTIVLVLGMLVCPWVHGAEIAVVGIHSERLGFTEARESLETLQKAAGSLEELTVVGPRELRERLIGRQSLILEGMALADGMKRLEAGKLLYDRADMAQAVAELEKALEVLAHSVAVTGEVRPLRDAYLFLGLSHTGLGDLDQAKKAFANAVVLDPEMELDPLRYPPRVQEAFARIRERIRGAMNASLQIQVPEDLEVEIWVDGRKRGQAPLVVEGLPPGRHFVRAVGPGAHRGYKTIGLSTGQFMPLFLPMDQHGMGSVAVSQQGRVQQSEALYRALGEHTQTELILVAVEGDSGALNLYLYSTLSERFSKGLEVGGVDLPQSMLRQAFSDLLAQATAQGEIRSDQMALQAPDLKVNSNRVLADLLLQDLRSASGGMDLAAGGKDSSPGWLRKNAWWVAGGTAAIAGGAATAWVVYSQAGDNGTITVGPIP